LPDISILIVSFNTCSILRDCLKSIPRPSRDLTLEVIVVDNGSQDDSLGMVRSEFRWVKAIQSDINLGFGGANNRAYEEATGRYIVLLNSDAFLAPDSLLISFQKMEADATVGLAGGQLLGRDGTPQPSARMFPNLLREFLGMSGLAHRFARSKFFGQNDRTWADPQIDAEVDWVPGAYSIIRRDVLEKVGFFDPDFFLYCEEVDLCLRIQKAGYKIMYWPSIKVIHIGGESSRQVKTLEVSRSGTQLILWRMRSTLLFFRKHRSYSTAAICLLEIVWYRLRAIRKSLKRIPDNQTEAANLRKHAQLMEQAWRETDGGRVSPPQPW
jgi:GT2 family glycosyltransferase